MLKAMPAETGTGDFDSEHTKSLPCLALPLTLDSNTQSQRDPGSWDQRETSGLPFSPITPGVVASIG